MATNPSEVAMIEWGKNNPAPELGDYQSKTSPKLAFHFARRKFFDSDGGPEAVVDFEADDEEAKKKHKVAMAKWRRRERAAERRTELADAEAIRSDACNVAWQAMEGLRDTTPLSFAALAAKARAARYLDGAVGDELYLPLLRDIGVMAGEVEPEQSS